MITNLIITINQKDNETYVVEFEKDGKKQSITIMYDMLFKWCGGGIDFCDTPETVIGYIIRKIRLTQN